MFCNTFRVPSLVLLCWLNHRVFMSVHSNPLSSWYRPIPTCMARWHHQFTKRLVITQKLTSTNGVEKDPTDVWGV